MRMRMIWVWAISLVLAGCDKGSRLAADEAEAHFRVYQERYSQIVALVDECRPARTGSSYKRVWADGSSGAGLHCFRSGQDIGALEQALRQSGAISVHYMTEDGPESFSPGDPLKSVEIWVFSSGIVTSGTSIGFVYSPDPLAAAPDNFRDGDYNITRRLVGPPPHHWYWEQGSN